MTDSQPNITFTSGILESDIFKNKPGWWFKVYLYILLKVNRMDSGVLMAGQGVFTRQDIYANCGIIEDRVDPESLKHVIRYLRERGIIDTFKTQTGLIIRIIGYDKMVQESVRDVRPVNNSNVRPDIDDKALSPRPSKHGSKCPVSGSHEENPLPLCDGESAAGPGNPGSGDVYILHATSNSVKHEPHKRKSAPNADIPADHAIPDILKGLELYEKDPILCGKISGVLPSWKLAYPGVDIQKLIRALHAWEISNPNRRKSNRIKFFQNRISSTQDSPRRAAGPASAPIEPEVMKIIMAFKIKKGFKKDDTAWDDLNVERYRDPAASLLKYFGNYKEAVHCIDKIANDMDFKKLSWSFDTVLKWAADYRLNRGGDQ